MAELEALRARVEELENALAESEDKYRRSLADFQNFQRRAHVNEDESRKRGVAAVVESVITALDHFEQALSHDPAKMSAEQLVKGVRLIHGELVRAIGQHGAGVIDPKPGEEFDPERHLAVSRRASADMPPNHVVEVFQTGYTLGQRVLRPAKVVVSAGETEA